MGCPMSISVKPSGTTAFRTWERSWVEAETLNVEAGGSPAQLPARLLRWLDGGSFLPPRALLGQMEAYLTRLYCDGDPRIALAEAYASLWNRLHPFAPLRRLGMPVGGAPAAAGNQGPASEGWTSIWYELRVPEGCTLDFSWLLLPLLRAFPRAFSLPEFEVVQAVADPRRVQSVLEDDNGLRFSEGGLDMGGMRLGESVLSGSHFRDAGIPLPEGWDPDLDACLVRADYYCPRRRRVILHAGCAYGASGFLFRIGFRNALPQTWNPLSQLIRAVTESQGGVEEPAAAYLSPLDGASALLREPAPAYRGPFRFVYHQADDSISCDGRHLTKNVPARILRRLVRDYVQSGRREFEFRTFKRDSDIVTNRKRPNFEVRLRRVQEVILGVPCGLILHRPRPGLLELQASGPIEYAEEA